MPPHLVGVVDGGNHQVIFERSFSRLEGLVGDSWLHSVQPSSKVLAPGNSESCPGQLLRIQALRAFFRVVLGGKGALDRFGGEGVSETAVVFVFLGARDRGKRFWKQ